MTASDEELFFYWRLDSMRNREAFLQSRADRSKTLRAFLRGPDLFPDMLHNWHA
jgi:hypothetical protein